MHYKSLISILTLSCSSICVAASNPIQVQVFNSQSGQPSAKLNVVLEAQQNSQWVKIGEGQTDAQGQINSLYPKEKSNLDKGIYRITLQTGDWFKTQNQRSFYPEIPVVFVIDGSTDHYNLPVVISPYGYSTFKGN
ncbi:MAG: hydroxyisourate hydrolase [Acinetobacter sp.]